MTGRSQTEQAVAWFLRMQGEPLSATDQATFNRWLGVEGNQLALAKVQETWLAVDWIADEPVIAAERARVVRRSGATRRWRPLVAAASMAAVLCIGLVIAFERPWNFPRPMDGIAERSEAGEFIGTRVGERSSVTLADGSTVILNTDSAMRIAYSDKERRIVLERGQAFFTVAKHRPQPFAVYTAGQRVLATGTAFDVRVDPLQTQIVLVEGEVRVAAVGGKNSLPMVLRPGQKFVAQAGATSVVSSVDIEQAISWTSGRVIFRDTPLRDAVKEINRYSDRKLILADPATGAFPVNGVFLTGQPARFARAIVEIHPLSFREELSGEMLIVGRRQ